jgi:hypothetical protein
LFVLAMKLWGVLTVAIARGVCPSSIHRAE